MAVHKLVVLLGLLLTPVEQFLLQIYSQRTGFVKKKKAIYMQIVMEFNIGTSVQKASLKHYFNHIRQIGLQLLRIEKFDFSEKYCG
jgi:hypothetical protein